ncbi:MAG: sel1 repeat family protein [Desulfarculales bacterium]|jgi:TPR repeat protein|nr:sel1 repeat family protein [Desulfarculales bacterium]
MKYKSAFLSLSLFLACCCLAAALPACTLAPEEGERESMERAAAVLETGQNIFREELEEDIARLEKAAARGSAEAAILLLRIYSSPSLADLLRIPPNSCFEANALNMLKRLGERGDLAAQSYLADYFLSQETRERAPENLRQYFYWTRLAAGQGDLPAMGQLGYLYLNGCGVERDEEQGFQWSLAAARQGQPAARFNTAYCYYLGKGVEVNYPRAIYWLEQANLSGFARARRALAELYISAPPPYRDYHKAFLLYEEEEAATGSVEAMAGLGAAYEHGRGVKRDYRQAARCYEKASRRFRDLGNYHLSPLYHDMAERMYEMGREVDKDGDAALGRRKAAVDKNDNDAKAAPRRLKAE